MVSSIQIAGSFAVVLQHVGYCNSVQRTSAKVCRGAWLENLKYTILYTVFAPPPFLAVRDCLIYIPSGGDRVETLRFCAFCVFSNTASEMPVSLSFLPTHSAAS